MRPPSARIRVTFRVVCSSPCTRARKFLGDRLSPMQTTMVGIGVGIAAASAGTIIGALAAAGFTPRHFAMPSLMADLGTIEPRFDGFIAAVVVGMALAAVALGMAPTAWWLHRR